MSQRSLRCADGLRWAVPMTPPELFFDLAFIVAVASAVESLHGALARGRGTPRPERRPR